MCGSYLETTGKPTGEESRIDTEETAHSVEEGLPSTTNGGWLATIWETR